MGSGHVLVQQLKIRDFSLGKLLLVSEHNHTQTCKHKLKSVCMHVYPHVSKHVHRNPFSFPGCVSRGISLTSRPAEVTSCPCLALRISQQDITSFSGPILVVGHSFCPGHQFKEIGTETICRQGFQEVLVDCVF